MDSLSATETTPQSLHLLRWTPFGPTEDVFDEVPELADDCVEREWNVNSLSVCGGTHRQILTCDAAGWWIRPLKDGGKTTI